MKIRNVAVAGHELRTGSCAIPDHDDNSPMTETISIDDCEKIQVRLREAERLATEALASAPADDPLAESTAELLRVHSEVRQIIRRAIESESERREDEDAQFRDAEIQIEAEAHEARPEPLDVLKALFMWRDDPAERAKNGR